MIDTAVITRFINIVRSVKGWRNSTHLLSTEETLTIHLILREAGFEYKMITFGDLTDSRHNFDEELETFPVNTLSPVMVMLENGAPHINATGWLDCLFRHITYDCPKGEEHSTLNEQKVRIAIADSRPLDPMKLTAVGDIFVEGYPSLKPSGYTYFVRHTRDGDELTHIVGHHKRCGSQFNRRGATDTHDALVCFGCHIRVLFPREVRTYGELRAAFAHVR